MSVFAWALLLQAGVGGPSLKEVAELREAGDYQTALEKVRLLDEGKGSDASCVHADLAEAMGKKVEAFRAVRRCVAHLRWEMAPHLEYSELEDQLRTHVTKLVPDGDIVAEYRGEPVAWPLWVERGERVSLKIQLPDGSNAERTVRAEEETMRISPPASELAATTSVTVNGDVDASTNTNTTTNYFGEAPPGSFPLRKMTQITGVVVGVAGAGIAGLGLANYLSATSDANDSARDTNEMGGCPSAGPRCEDWDDAVKRRDSAHGTIITGGAILAAGATVLIVGSFLPKWVGGEASRTHARLTFSSSF